MKTLIFLRHGKTKYTGVLPDLTDEGKQEIRDAAHHIAELVAQQGAQTIEIVSSPAPRALGSADIIASCLGLVGSSGGLKQEPAIRSMDFYDEVDAGLLWKSFPSARDVDRAYATDPRFEAGDVIEPRSMIQYRFWKYLGGLFERLIDDDLPDVMIHTSHFEVLWFLTSLFGFKEPLIHGEVIRLELTLIDSPNSDNIVRVRGIFREFAKEFECPTLTTAFMGGIFRQMRTTS